MKIFYKDDKETNVRLKYTLTEKDAISIYGAGEYSETTIKFDSTKQYLFVNDNSKIVIKDSPKKIIPTKEEKEEKKQDFKVNVISKKSIFVSQRALNKLNLKRIKKQITKDVFMESHKELQLILLLLTNGDIRGSWIHLKHVKTNNLSVPEDVLRFLTNNIRRLLRKHYPKFLKNKLNK